MHAHETLCSHIAPIMVLQRAQNWFIICTLLLYSVYICYIVYGSNSIGSLC